MAARHHVVAVSFVPVSRDRNNDVFLLDPSEGEGAALAQTVKERSPQAPSIRSRPGGLASGDVEITPVTCACRRCL